MKILTVMISIYQITTKSRRAANSKFIIGKKYQIQALKVLFFKLRLINMNFGLIQNNQMEFNEFFKMNFDNYFHQLLLYYVNEEVFK